MGSNSNCLFNPKSPNSLKLMTEVRHSFQTLYEFILLRSKKKSQATNSWYKFYFEHDVYININHICYMDDCIFYLVFFRIIFIQWHLYRRWQICTFTTCAIPYDFLGPVEQIYIRRNGGIALQLPSCMWCRSPYFILFTITW